jgi:hypothetical protein
MKNKTPLELVQEIHNSVLTSSDQCLDEVNKILATAVEKETETYEKMASLGFGKVKEIAERKELIEKNKEARHKAEIINGYKVKYPHKKFISTEAMDEICEKYKLTLGADQHFNGSMPERSMKEIIDFKLVKEDEIYYKGTFRLINAGLQESDGVIDWVKITEEKFLTETNNGTKLIFNERKRNQTHYISNKNYFMIAAPEQMFDIDGMVKEGNQLKKVVKIDDPICLKVVDYGYIVVSVWGEEMAIERMKNEKLN